MQRHFSDSDQLCRYLGERSDTVILSFSLGKDSIGAWLHLRRYFQHIIPFYLYLVPGLGFVERALAYYEKYFKTQIIQMPHPSLYRLLRNLVFQAPENCSIVEEADLDSFSYDDCAKQVIKSCGLSSGTMTAHGTRAADSLMRRTSLKKWGAVNQNRKTFWPIFDWNKARLIDELRRANVKLPVDYEMFGRSFDGIDYRFLKPISERYPEDYQKILEFFPLAELEIKRREWRERYYAKQG